MTSPWERYCSHHSEGLCEDILRRMRGVVKGEVFDLLGSVPGCLEAFWLALRPALDCYRIESAAASLREYCSTIIPNIARLPDELKWLKESGYSREDIRQIRYVTEVFYGMEPVLIIVSAIAYRWLEGKTPVVARARDICGEPVISARFFGEIEYADSAKSIGCYERPNHPFYKALGVWPEFVLKVHGDMEPAILDHKYSESVSSTREITEELAGNIPILKYTRDSGINWHRLLSSLDNCIEASAEVVILSSILRQAFIRSEIATRRQWIRETEA